MTPLGIVFFAGLTIRAVILLLLPRYASLTLDADGFTISMCSTTSAGPGAR